MAAAIFACTALVAVAGGGVAAQAGSATGRAGSPAFSEPVRSGAAHPPAGESASAAKGGTVRVRVLRRHAPAWIEIDGPTRHLVRATAAGPAVDGAASAALALPAARWRLRGSGFDRVYDGALRITASRGTLEVEIEQALEAYVADVVAAESDPGTPPAALRALAVVVRSFALAGGAHEGGAFCDLAHCQITRGRANGAARGAARATAGQVLLLPDRSVARALFHASCGGHTADPAALFGGVDRSGARPVAEPGCSASWEAHLPLADAEAAAAPLFGGSVALARLRREGGDWLDPARGVRVRGEALARALDRRAGWGVVRSPRFELAVAGAHVHLRGRGHGHGAGLCQAGAVRLAREGIDHRAILARYFTATVASAPSRRSAEAP